VILLEEISAPMNDTNVNDFTRPNQLHFLNIVIWNCSFSSFLQPISAESSALRFDVIEVNVSLFLETEMLFSIFLSHNVNVKVTTNP
jgi:hypothetical protein